jgi:hypothetical protein
MLTNTRKTALILSLASLSLIDGEPPRFPITPASQITACAQPQSASAPEAIASSDASALSPAAPGSCTIFTAVQGETVLFGNNEDWINPETRYWAIPSRGERYGGVYFGFDNYYPQGGINQMGLAYDVNSTPPAPLNAHPDRPPLSRRFFRHMLEQCATVEEAIAFALKYNWGTEMGGQIHLADASGDAAVISAGPDRELAITRKPQGDGFLVSTNFNLADHRSTPSGCWRYDTATSMLGQLSKKADLTIEFARDILDATHQESASVNTVYSNVFDLQNGVIYLYHWYQFDEVVTLDVDQLTTAHPISAPIRDLFSPETVQRADLAYQAHQQALTSGKTAAWVWLAATAVSLLLVLVDLARRDRGYWRTALIRLFVVAFLGPLGLLADILVYRRSLPSHVSPSSSAKLRSAIGSAMYSAAGYALTWLLALLYFIFFLPNPTPAQVLLATFGIPPVVGMLVLRTPLVSAQWGLGYGKTLLRLAIPEFASAAAAFAGMFPVLFLLDNHWFPGPFDVADPRFWLLISFTALGGTLPVILLNLWTARRNLRGLPVSFPGGETSPDGSPARMPTLRTAWPEALVSLVAAFASLALTVPFLG